MEPASTQNLLSRIEELESRLEESEQLIEAIKAGEVDAFALRRNNKSEIYTLQTGDYAYRILVENFGEGALNLTEDGLIVYTNTYFHELVNLAYEKTIGSYVFQFIHPDSTEKFNMLFKQGLAGQSKGEINLIAKDEVIPVYVSLTSLYPTLPTVGMIVTDFTEKKKREEVILQYQRELEAKNLELAQSNTELESFTYIASHDLQEPLRKIQTFSKLILEREHDHLPDTAKEYFRRITKASERMQKLIIALLNYSRMSTAERVFVPTDLNRTLNEVKNNLREMVEETHATIESSPLPTLSVVPLQINQLFSNILINCIKYRKPGAAPMISISANLINADELPLKGSSLYEKFWRVIISDSGIGFDQKYAELIFELFQRLHGNKEFEGTGIGLAICKRIVQNHDGIITAEGRPGDGATFNIYLPERK